MLLVIDRLSDERLLCLLVLFDEKQLDLGSQITQLKSRIDHRANLILALIAKWRVIYQHKINEYSQIDRSTREDITEQYQSIERRLETFLQYVDRRHAGWSPAHDWSFFTFCIVPISPILFSQLHCFRESKISNINYIEERNSSSTAWIIDRPIPSPISMHSRWVHSPLTSSMITLNRWRMMRHWLIPPKNISHLMNNPAMMMMMGVQRVRRAPRSLWKTKKTWCKKVIVQSHRCPWPMFQKKNFSGLCTSNSSHNTSHSTDNRFFSHRIVGDLSGRTLLWLPEMQMADRRTLIAAHGPIPTLELSQCRKGPSCSFHNSAWELGHASTSNRSASVSSVQKLCFWFGFSRCCCFNRLDNPYICVFVKGSDDSLTNFIAFFTHTGQLQLKVDHDHQYSLRQLICDESTKGNCICK